MLIYNEYFSLLFTLIKFCFSVNLLVTKIIEKLKIKAKNLFGSHIVKVIYNLHIFRQNKISIINVVQFTDVFEIILIYNYEF